MSTPWPWSRPADEGEQAPGLQAFDAGFRGDWEWVQPARFRRRWELLCGGTAVARLVAPGILHGRNVARFADSAWRYRMRLGGGLEVTREGEPAPWGRYCPGWFTGGSVQRAHDAPLLWRRQDFWMMRWALLTSEHLPLLRFEVRPAFLRLGARVTIEDAARRMDDLPALVALGWLAVVMAHRGHSHYH